MTHRPHPITGRWPAADPDTGDLEARDYDDPRDAILFDDCERCTEHAEHLTSLDDANLAELWTRMLGEEKGWQGKGNAYRTDTEARAGRELYRIGVILERLAGGVIDPWTYPLRINVPTATVDTGGT